MNVAFDHQIFALQRYGGISRIFTELALRLPKFGVTNATIFAPLHINQYLRTLPSTARGQYVPARFRGLSTLLLHANASLTPALSSRSRYDIVHETYYSAAPTKISGKRVVTVHDMIHELHPDLFPNAARSRQIKLAAVQRADHVICVSSHTRAQLLRLFRVDERKVSVVHNGFEMRAPTPSEKSPTTGRPYILYVGERGGYKNFARVLKAFAASSRLRSSLSLLAFGGRDFSPLERQRISESGLEKCVHWREGGDNQLAAAYRHAALFVYPSLHEGFGIAPLEAMQNGCPVVCSDGGAIPEIVSEAGYYFDPSNDESLVSALEAVAFNSDLANRLRQSGHARVKQFSWDRCAEETARVYQLLLET